MNQLDYICFDFETGGLSADTHEAVSVAGKAYNARTLEPYPPSQGGEFYSLMRPLDFNRLDPKAMAINKISEAELKAAPEQSVVWKQFVAWVGRFNKSKKEFTAPLVCGKNIRNFDLAFVRKLNELHCKGDKTVLFNRRHQRDLEDYLFDWFENDPNGPPDFKMDTLRDYFGVPKEGAHNALVDVRHTGLLYFRFLKLCRTLRSRLCKDGNPFIQMRHAFAPEELAALSTPYACPALRGMIQPN